MLRRVSVPQVRRSLAVGLLLALLAILGAGGALVASGSLRPPPAPAYPRLASVATAPAVGASAPDPTTDGLQRTLTPLLAAPALGQVAAVVADPESGRTLWQRNGDAPVTPASTAKLATAVAALTVLGPDDRFTTSAVLGPDRELVLVGGGDPTLASPKAPPIYPPGASMAELAAKAADALAKRGLRSVRVAVDASLFSGPTTAPGWKPSYVPTGNVSPVTALSVDGGRLNPDADPRTPDLRAPDPPIAAGQVFAGLLTAHGITVTAPVAGAAAPPAAPELAAVQSPPLADFVERMLQHSDNDMAEALARQVALAQHQPPTFAGGAAAVRDVLSRLGVSGVDLVDGSGLSVDDRVTVHALAQLLALAASPTHPELRSIVTGLPVAGFSGTLGDRFRTSTGGRGAGMVRAKTGTLAMVSGLAGLVVDADGRELVFATVANDVPDVLGAEAALDRVAAALSGCGCR